MRLLRFARNDKGLVPDLEGGITPSVKRDYAKLLTEIKICIFLKGYCHIRFCVEEPF